MGTESSIFARRRGNLRGGRNSDSGREVPTDCASGANCHRQRKGRAHRDGRLLGELHEGRHRPDVRGAAVRGRLCARAGAGVFRVRHGPDGHCGLLPRGSRCLAHSHHHLQLPEHRQWTEPQPRDATATRPPQQHRCREADLRRDCQGGSSRRNSSARVIRRAGRPGRLAAPRAVCGWSGLHCRRLKLVSAGEFLEHDPRRDSAPVRQGRHCGGGGAAAQDEPGRAGVRAGRAKWDQMARGQQSWIPGRERALPQANTAVCGCEEDG
ncbi:hypothetical protein VFPFJ_11047 [Purpureocillium lilacinum]|uniref:Uncharacterized protein n=1 Tax=Purpureocillium lilacinum TaxID=33203 RepID=A0A179G0S5_PURLI|nr:hypothetical protein VFPFJ_11047 [Purpureocillium lilacinum]OAQ71506.1 hypothetical protein VFPFJ_11047 [Purpureocillium lilacinum]